MRNRNPGQKTILLATTLQLASTARLAMALLDCGASVAVLCPRGHWVHTISRVDRVDHYSALHPLTSLRRAIIEVAPDLIIPCDDRTVSHMQELAATLGAPGGDVLRLSLASFNRYEMTQSRHAFLTMAERLGILIPRTHAVRDEEQVLRLLTGTGPWVVKADHSWAGMGVRVVADVEAACGAYFEMSRPKRLRTVVSEAIIDRDLFDIRAWWRRVSNEITVQEYIAGKPANCAVACWKGEVLGMTMVEVVTTESETGPATMVRLIDHAEMAEAARRLVRELGISGLVGFDFMIDADGRAYLLEINPRNVPICHIRLAGERDLVERLVARLENRDPHDREPITQSEIITYFPFAWQTNPNDSALHVGYHDVPWGEPDLLRRLMTGEQRRERSRLARLLRLCRAGAARMRQRRPTEQVGDLVVGHRS